MGRSYGTSDGLWQPSGEVEVHCRKHVETGWKLGASYYLVQGIATWAEMKNQK